MIRRQGVSAPHQLTKCKADSLIRSKVITGPKIWKLGHVTLAMPAWDVLWSVRSQDSSSISTPSLKRIA